MSEPKPCGAVFRVGANTPAGCALRFNHLGLHRTWQQVADDREALEARLSRAVETLSQVEHSVRVILDNRARCPLCECTPRSEGGDNHDAECQVGLVLASERPQKEEP